MKIYLASSWRNKQQPEVLKALRDAGHEVYDFRNPKPGDKGFAWSEIDENWRKWNNFEFMKALTHPISRRGFQNDWGAMQWADAGVLLLPSGRSAHIEAGYFVGACKPLIVILGLDPQEPELMYKMATAVCVTTEVAVDILDKLQIQKANATLQKVP